MKTLRKETIIFYKTILEHKTSETTASISKNIFKCSQSSFYKKLNTLETLGFLSIINHTNGLITVKINNDYDIKINKRNTIFKPFVKLTKQQQKIFQHLKSETETLHSCRITDFCKKHNIDSKSINNVLTSLHKNGAIALSKKNPGVYSIQINDIKLIGDKQKSDILGKIYVIQNIQSKNIKIGFTTKDINYRIKQLQTGNENKLKLLFLIDGGFKTETSIHKKFKELRMEGEWFKFNKKIINYFNSQV